MKPQEPKAPTMLCNQCGCALEWVKDERVFYHPQGSWQASMMPRLPNSGGICAKAGWKFKPNKK